MKPGRNRLGFCGRVRVGSLQEADGAVGRTGGVYGGQSFRPFDEDRTLSMGLVRLRSPLFSDAGRIAKA